MNAWDAGALSACRDATAPLITVGERPEADLRLKAWSALEAGTEATLTWRGRELALTIPQPGLHNLQNAAVAIAAAAAAGVDPSAAAESMSGFPGVARRMEVVDEIDEADSEGTAQPDADRPRRPQATKNPAGARRAGMVGD